MAENDRAGAANTADAAGSTTPNAPVDGGLYEEPGIRSGPAESGAGDGSNIGWTGGENMTGRGGGAETGEGTSGRGDQGEAGAGAAATQGSV